MRYVAFIVISIITAFILWINARLYLENYSPKEKKEDILLQLNFLEGELKNNFLGINMQSIFPEGYVFINSLYGLTWCELALSDSMNELNIRKKAIDEAIYAYNEVNSNKARWTFDNSLNPDYGIFYAGWKNYLLSKILSLDTAFAEHDKYIVMFRKQSDQIAEALKGSKIPFLESYESQAWPADMCVAMASLSNYDKVFLPKYSKVIDNWIIDVKEKSDPEFKMIPHKVDAVSGVPLQGPRGCSMSLILRMLAETDIEFAEEQFRKFNSGFVSKTFGLPSIREYPKGISGSGDIDSGPVIFGVGFTATIMMIGTYALFDQSGTGDIQYKTVNAFGFSKKKHNQKKYLFGKLPMADAFIAWGRASALNSSYHSINQKNYLWRLKFHFLSFLIIALFWLLFFVKRILHRELFPLNKSA